MSFRILRISKRLSIDSERVENILLAIHNRRVIPHGKPRCEFLYSVNIADACVFLMDLPEDVFVSLLGSDESASGIFQPPLAIIA
mgnify:CR=1 FL=1